MTSSPDGPSPRSRPLPLRLAAGLTVAQGAALAVYGVLEAASITPGRITMGITTSLFFLAYGAAVAWCGVGLSRARTWARGPAVLAQLIWLGVAWSFRGGSTTWVAVAVALTAAVTLVCLFHPRTTKTLVGSD